MHYKIEYTVFLNIVKILKTIKGLHTNNLEKLQTFIEAAYFILKGGCQWRMLPSYYGCWRAVHKRFVAWSKHGIWGKIFDYAKVDPDLEYELSHLTVVRVRVCYS